jgi:hypothetical protein
LYEKPLANCNPDHLPTPLSPLGRGPVNPAGLNLRHNPVLREQSARHFVPPTQALCSFLIGLIDPGLVQLMDDVLKQQGQMAAPGGHAPRASRKSAAKPEWATGLKRFYDSVVEEPLPDDLAALLSKLDDGSGA